jgi:phosphatidylglycerol:prolipoprotein diacylglycerol transferase
MNYTWWNLLPTTFDGTLVTVGSFPIRYYGLMYLLAFLTAYKVMQYTIKRENIDFKAEHLEGMMTWIIGGILIGARLGYVFFYNFSYYSQHLGEILMPFSFEGGFHFTGISGMSYHGGLIGATIGGLLYLRKNKLSFWTAANLAATATPLGYTWGRWGNFLNGELYGRPTDSSIGMLFPADKTQLLRHPSQLYEAFGEGLVLFAILFSIRIYFPKLREHIMGLYLIGYGIIRYIIEYFREPDAHLGLNSLGFSRGQLLCIAMIIAGIIFIAIRKKQLAKTVS